MKTYVDLNDEMIDSENINPQDLIDRTLWVKKKDYDDLSALFSICKRTLLHLNSIAGNLAYDCEDLDSIKQYEALQEKMKTQGWFV